MAKWRVSIDAYELVEADTEEQAVVSFLEGLKPEDCEAESDDDDEDDDDDEEEDEENDEKAT